MKTFFEVAFEVLGCAVLVIGMITIFAGAVLQKRIELISPIDVVPYARVIGKFYFKDVKKKYGDKEVVSIMNFNDTRTTSIAIKL